MSLHLSQVFFVLGAPERLPSSIYLIGLSVEQQHRLCPAKQSTQPLPFVLDEVSRHTTFQMTEVPASIWHSDECSV